MASTNEDQENSLASTVRKRILWNVVEPGDPYNIEKYMGFKIDL